MTNVVEQAGTADELRAALAAELIAADTIRTSRVEQAFRRAPRHLFAPGASLVEAYSDDVVVTKRDRHGIAISSVSAPGIIATMLEQSDVKPGHRVLEIGSGGYNAALLRELVGPDGQVTTVDIDAEVTDRAEKCLAAAGYDDVVVACVDGEKGMPERAPYDRVIVTVGAWDIPPAWVDQLAGGGRLVVPIRMRGLTRAVAFECDENRLVSRGYELCGFVPMQGEGERRERLVTLHGDLVGLRLDDGFQVDVEPLKEALTQPRNEEWSGVTVGTEERFDGLHLWLMLNLVNFCLLAAQREAVEQDLVTTRPPLGVPTTVRGGSFAYLTSRQIDTDLYEFGANAHGPEGASLAAELVRHIQSWDGTSLNAHITAYPKNFAHEEAPESALLLDKRHVRLAISWSSPDGQAAREKPNK